MVDILRTLPTVDGECSRLLPTFDSECSLLLPTPDGECSPFLPTFDGERSSLNFYMDETGVNLCGNIATNFLIVIFDFCS